MNIIELARASGCHDNGKEFRFIELRYLERFAALVRAAALDEAAGVCDREAKHAYQNDGLDDGYESGKSVAAKNCAAAIRALKETK